MALQAAGYTVTTLDYTGQPINPGNADVIFPILHGVGGEDGTIQRQLDATGLQYVGSGVDASKLCFDKWLFKQHLKAHQLPVSEGGIVDMAAFRSSPLISSPFVLKPNDGGSSVDTLIIRDVSNLDQAAVAAAYTRHQTMLLEPLIQGHEITVGVLGDTALPVIEIIPPESGEFDYENKYNGRSQELCPPKHVSPEIQVKAQTLALQIHTLCGCRDYSRTDMIVTSTGDLRVLETNTIPGLTDQSLLPKAALAAGLDFPSLTDRLVTLAMNR